jgi:hypothetical protein
VAVNVGDGASVSVGDDVRVGIDVGRCVGVLVKDQKLVGVGEDEGAGGGVAVEVGGTPAVAVRVAIPVAVGPHRPAGTVGREGSSGPNNCRSRTICWMISGWTGAMTTNGHAA